MRPDPARGRIHRAAPATAPISDTARWAPAGLSMSRRGPWCVDDVEWAHPSHRKHSIFWSKSIAALNDLIGLESGTLTCKKSALCFNLNVCIDLIYPAPTIMPPSMNDRLSEVSEPRIFPHSFRSKWPGPSSSDNKARRASRNILSRFEFNITATQATIDQLRASVRSPHMP